MGKKALQIKRITRRTIRTSRLSEQEQAWLKTHAKYEGSPFHKRSPRDFGLTPPASPRPDKTLCEEAGAIDKQTAFGLFSKAIHGGLVSESSAKDRFPKQLWTTDDRGHVFEVIYSQNGCYHGYPIRKKDPLYDQVLKALDVENG